MTRVWLAAALVAAVAATAAAQFRQFGGFAPRGYAARYARAETFGHGFNFCRAMYTSGPITVSSPISVAFAKTDLQTTVPDPMSARLPTRTDP